MTSFIEWWNRLPRAARWGLCALALLIECSMAYLIVAYATYLNPWSESDDVNIGWVWALLVALIFLSWLSVAVLGQRRRLGGKRQVDLYRRAMRTGHVHAEARRDKWLPVFEKQERSVVELRRFSRVGWWAFVVVTIVSVIGAISGSPGWQWSLAGIPVMGALAWHNSRSIRRLQRQYARLRETLDNATDE